MPPRSLALALLLLATAARAQEAPVTTLKLSTQLVLIDATVLDRKSQLRIPDLTPGDFTLVEDGTPQTVTYLSEDRLPLSIVFMFDATDTVQPVLHSLAKNSSAILTHLRPEDEAAVMTFSSDARLIEDFTHDHTVLETAFQRAAGVHDRFMTLVINCLYEATQQANKATLPNSRRVEVWLTDGTTQDLLGSNSTRARRSLPAAHTADQTREFILRSNVVVSGLIERSWMTDFVDPKLAVSGSLGRVAEYGNLTGGPFFKTGRKEVTDKFALLLDTLRQRYTLGFKPSVPHEPGTLCHLTLTLSPAFYKRHITLTPKDIVLQTRQSYYR